MKFLKVVLHFLFRKCKKNSISRNNYTFGRRNDVMMQKKFGCVKFSPQNRKTKFGNFDRPLVSSSLVITRSVVESNRTIMRKYRVHSNPGFQIDHESGESS